MAAAKNIVYQYPHTHLADDLEADPKGECALKKGDIITRKGKLWLVASVHPDTDEVVATMWIDLVHAPVN